MMQIKLIFTTKVFESEIFGTRKWPIVGFHMTSLKFKIKKTIDPTEILLSRCLRAAETNFRFKRVLGFEIEYA